MLTRIYCGLGYLSFDNWYGRKRFIQESLCYLNNDNLCCCSQFDVGPCDPVVVSELCRWLCAQQTLRFFWWFNLDSRKETILSLTNPCNVVLSMLGSPCWLPARLPHLLLCLRLSLPRSSSLLVVLPSPLSCGSSLLLLSDMEFR